MWNNVLEKVGCGRTSGEVKEGLEEARNKGGGRNGATILGLGAVQQAL